MNWSKIIDRSIQTLLLLIFGAFIVGVLLEWGALIISAITFMAIGWVIVQVSDEPHP